MIKRNPAQEPRWPLRVVASGPESVTPDRDDAPAASEQKVKKLHVVDRRERSKPPGLY